MEASLSLLTTDYPELLEHIATFLADTHIAFSLRPVCKDTAALFSAPKYKAVRLSQSCPAFAFQERWGCSSAFAQLQLSQRRQLLSLVAASGDVENVDCVMANAPDSWSTATLSSAARAGHRDVLRSVADQGAIIDTHVLDAAAGVGNLEMCQHLTSTYDTCKPSSSTLEAAAGGGHFRLVQWLLLEAKCPWSNEAMHTAAAGGHTELLAWLLQQPQLHDEGLERSWSSAVVGAAAGCDFATFRQLLEEPWPPGPHNAAAVRYTPERHPWQCMVQEAAGSCTFDWQAKVELLLEHPLYDMWRQLPWSWNKAATRPDAEDRLRQLFAQGVPSGNALFMVCQDPSTSLGAVRLALEHSSAWLSTCHTEAACGTGRVDILQALRDAGCPFSTSCIYLAAGAGHLPAVQWIREHLPAEQRRLTAEVFRAAAGSGNLSLLWWLSMQEDAGTCPQAYNAAAAAGSVEVIRWLYALDLPFPATGAPYLAAARHGSVLAMRALASLGCPWGRRGRVLARVICAANVSVYGLQELLRCGCPVVWRSALGASKLRGDLGVEAWLRGLWEESKRALAEMRARTGEP